MNERTALLAGAALGAVVGAAAAFLLFTDRGRAMRDDLEPTVRDLMRDAGKLQGAVAQIRESVAGSTERSTWTRPSA